MCTILFPCNLDLSMRTLACSEVSSFKERYIAAWCLQNIKGAGNPDSTRTHQWNMKYGTYISRGWQGDIMETQKVYNIKLFIISTRGWQGRHWYGGAEGVRGVYSFMGGPAGKAQEDWKGMFLCGNSNFVISIYTYISISYFCSHCSDMYGCNTINSWFTYDRGGVPCRGIRDPGEFSYV